MFNSKTRSISPTRVSIKEANDHLQMVHCRMDQLEAIVDQQKIEIDKIEERYRQEVEDEMKEKIQAQEKIIELNKEIDLLKDQIGKLQLTVNNQQEIINEKIRNEHKFNEIKSLVPAIEKLIALVNGIHINNVKDGQTFINVKDGQTFINGDHYEMGKSAKRMVKYCDSLIKQNQNNDDAYNSSSSSSFQGFSEQNQSAQNYQGISLASTLIPPRNSKSNSSNSSSKSHSSIKIAKSFNITSNFSDDEEDLINHRTSNKSKHFIKSNTQA